MTDPSIEAPEQLAAWRQVLRLATDGAEDVEVDWGDPRSAAIGVGEAVTDVCPFCNHPMVDHYRGSDGGDSTEHVWCETDACRCFRSPRGFSDGLLSLVPGLGG